MLSIILAVIIAFAALLDHQMPDCDGAELGRVIINDEHLESTRHILLTSSGQRGEGQMFAVRMLEKLNYRVTVVPDGSSAVDHWKSGYYDL